MSETSIAVGVMHDSMMDAPFVVSLSRLLQVAPMPIIFQGGQIGRLDIGRNKVIENFLRYDAEWLLFLDTDMVFTPQDFVTLAQSANDKTAPIVSGLYYQDTMPPRPVAFVWDKNGRSQHWDGKGTGMVKVDLVGMGFVLIHRSVLEAMEGDWCNNGRLGPAHQSLSDDFSFCYKAQELGFDIKLNTAVKPGHVKQTVWYGG
jgi:hypothetical protein